MNKPLIPTWDLEVIFPGGSDSPQFANYLTELSQEIVTFGEQVANLSHNSLHEEWEKTIQDLQNINAKIRQAGAFTSCLTAQNVKDTKARLLSGQVRQIRASLGSTLTILDEKMLAFPETQWQALLQQPVLSELQFILNERRQRAQDKLSAEQESLANDLAVDGYHAWGELYNTIVGQMGIKVEVEGTQKEVSMGQASNLISDPNRQIRQDVFYKYEEAWSEKAELFSNCLNHLAGFRLTLYRNRGWDEVLKEPLEINRMSAATLEVMWDTITKSKPKVVEFLNRKAKLMGLSKLAWYDVEAPLGSSVNKMSYDQGAEFIVDQFRKFDPEMADFAVGAFENRWIEAEDRPGKRPGGFCTSFPLQEQSRIFMTYDGSASNVATLAHELGHAYHQHVMQDLPQLNKGYAMNVAETASTFGEMLVSDAAIKNASNEEERLALLEDKIQRSVAFFMNIHARFLFETSFYEQRKKGLLSVEEINYLMLEAQKEAYLDSLDEWHPHFWASKLHFYITGTPFYNFPYTFGYLFSSGIYARALAEGSGFASKYRDLLRDTGRMQVEELAKKHLGVDLTGPEFWQQAVDLAVADIDEFLKLTK